MPRGIPPNGTSPASKHLGIQLQEELQSSSPEFFISHEKQGKTQSLQSQLAQCNKEPWMGSAAEERAVSRRQVNPH